jgi:hypothetical protein
MGKRLALIAGVVTSCLLMMVIVLPLILIWAPICGVVWAVKGDSFDAMEYITAPIDWLVNLPYDILKMEP